MLNRTIAPDYGEIKEFRFIEPKTAVLANGVSCCFLSAGTEEVLKIDFIFRAGSKMQQKKCVALATNSLLLEGTNSLTALQIAEQLDNYGAFTQSSCTADDAIFSLYCLNKHAEGCIAFICDVLSSVSFPESELFTYASTQSQRLEIVRKKTSYLSRVGFYQALFGENHPYGRTANPEDYKGLTSDDLRKFYHDHYSSNSLRLICSGKITPEVQNIIEDKLGKLQLNTHAKEVAIDPLGSLLNQATQKERFIEKLDAVQCSIKIGKRLFNRQNPDYQKLQILNVVFGGYFGSRLMKNIREEKGLTYGIHSGLESYQEDGVFFISTEVNNDLRDIVVNEIKMELNLLKTELIPEVELKTAKNYLLGSFLRSLDGPFAQAERIKILLDYNLPQSYYTRFLDTIRDIKAEELRQLANKYLDIDSMYWISSGKT